MHDLSSKEVADRLSENPAGRSDLFERFVLLGVGLLFSLPFLQPFHRAPLPSFESEWLAAVLLAGTLLCAAASGRTKLELQWPLPVFCLALIAVAFIHQQSGRMLYDYSLSNLVIAVVAVLGAYCLGRWTLQRGMVTAAVRAASAAAVVGGLLSVVLQFMQVVQLEGLPEWLVAVHGRTLTSQPYANVGQPNHLATYLAVGLVGTVFLDSQHWPRLFIRFAQVALAGGIALTGSRMGLLMLVLLGLTPFVRTRLTVLRAELSWRLSGALFAGFLVIAVVASALSASVVGSQSTLERVSQAQYGDRLTMWADAARITATSPLFGVGPGEYAKAQYWLAQASPKLIGTPYAHNAALQFAAEFGLIAGAAFILLCLWWLACNWSHRRKNADLLAIWAMAFLLGIHAMLEWSLWILFVAIIAAFLFALGEPPLRRVGRINSRLIFGTLGIAGLAWAPLMWADYDSIAGANSHLEFELGVGLGVGGDTVEGLRSVSASTYFKPQADRFVVRAAPPVQKPVDGADVERTWKVLTRLPEERTIAVYVAALAISGRVTDALPHVERMRVFAVTSERYRRAEEIVQKAIKDEGTIVEPLRLELARWR